MGFSKLANTSTGLDSFARSSICSSNRLAIKVRHKACVAGANKIARAAEGIDLARTAKVLRTGRSGGGILDSEKAASSRSILDRCHYAGERVALGKNLSTSGDLERVAAVVLPVVVHGMQDGVTSDLRSAARGTVDVVALEGDGVLRTSEVERPVMVVVACGRPI